MKFEDICSKIINEAKSKKEKENDTKTKVDGEKDKPKIITEKDIENTNEIPAESPAELEGIELEFLEKFIRLAELNCLIKCQKTIKKDFKSILGKNNTAVENYLTKHNDEIAKELDNLKIELTSLREQIQTAEKANVETAERKLSLISILDKNVKPEETVSEK